MGASVRVAAQRMAAGANSTIDRLIGADKLKPRVRERLLGQQLASALQMGPILAVGSTLVILILVAIMLRDPHFLMLAALAAAIIVTYGGGAIGWSRNLAQGAIFRNPPKAVALIIANAVLAGCLWAGVLVMVPFDDTLIRTAATIGVGGVLCASIMALAHYPQAAIAFVAPIFVGAVIANSSLHSGEDLSTQVALLVISLVVMAALSLRHARSFVQHHVSDDLVNENREIIALLLKEFEESVSDWLWGFDREGLIDRVSQGFMRAIGVSEEDLIGADFQRFLDSITPRDDPLLARLRADVAARQTFSDIELRVFAGGQERWWCLTGKPTYDEKGEYLGYIGMGSDISAAKQAGRRMQKLAHNDHLTGLHNRAKFNEHLQQCVSRLGRYGTPFSVLFLDLDHFKLINDSRGHQTGDEVLVQVTGRIQSLVRETDFLARLGGDEFSIVVSGDCAPENIATLATRLIEAVRTPFLIDGEMLSVGMSIGIALAPANGSDTDQLLRHADLALYRAKREGRCVYRVFEEQMDAEACQRRVLEVALRNALRNDELVLHYQPLVAAVDKRAIGFEALIRWNHPERGIVYPAEFIPIAEQSNLILGIGDWTIEQACRTAAGWPEHLSVAVNLSAKHFRQSDIAAVVRRALGETGLEPKRLELEITESLLIENPDQVIEKLREIHALGVTIAMDDFGTGYSGLSYLLKFPFDRIKIDRSFVEASSEDPVARDILRAITSMARTLQLSITAEGVETKEQADFLSEIACQYLQGFYFSQPLDAAELPVYLLANAQGRLRGSGPREHANGKVIELRAR
jgi:diguanylate cyclase (GGDEF)-like protein/PAS domain S-box-containing protein